MMTRMWLRSTSGSEWVDAHGRPASSSESSSSSALRLSATVNRGRSVGGTAGSARCGAHLSQSQAASPSPLAHSAIRNSDGACQVMACSVIAVAICRQATGLPSSRTRANDAQGQRDRQLAHRAVRAQESAEGDGGHDVDVFERLRLAEPQVEGEFLVAETEPDGGEVGIRRPAFPQSAGADQGLQAPWVGVQPEQRLGLIGGGRPGLAADLREVPEVVASFAGDAAGAVPAHSGQLAAGHGQCRDTEHHPGGDVRAGAARGEDQRHRAEPAQGGQHHQPGGHAAGLPLREGRWRVNLDLADHHRRRFPARWAPERHHRHCRIPASRSRAEDPGRCALDEVVGASDAS